VRFALDAVGDGLQRVEDLAGDRLAARLERLREQLGRDLRDPPDLAPAEHGWRAMPLSSATRFIDLPVSPGFVRIVSATPGFRPVVEFDCPTFAAATRADSPP
jgi:hypothetical protein